jgi:OmpA-OmpF porin, OOP family
MSLSTRLGRVALAGATAVTLLASPLFAADGDTSVIKGIIHNVQGPELGVTDGNNKIQHINLLPTTEVKSVSGALSANKNTVEQSALIPGLPITANVVVHGMGYDAVKIEFKKSDLKTAQQIQMGLHPTQQQVNANTNRMNDFGTNERLATADVFFASGSTAINAKGKEELTAFAHKAKETKGYQVAVVGYTDSTGDAEKNQALSKARATKVINYLQQTAGLSPARVHSGDGMGVAADAGTGSNQNARKVTAHLYVDKGVAAGSK